MGLGIPQGGYSLAAEFQSSGIPWVTSSVAPSGSVTHYAFQTCTRFFSVSNTGGSNQVLGFGFTQNGVVGTPPGTQQNVFLLSGSQTITLELRCKDLYLIGWNSACSFSLVAGLTTVLAQNVPLLTGSQIDFSTNTTASWAGVG